MLHISNGIVIEFSEGNEAYVLMDLEGGKVYKLNDQAYALLTSIQETGSLQNYYDKVKGQADETTIRQDASSYLEELIEKGYVTDDGN